MGTTEITLTNLQEIVDDWINKYGVKYFEERTNALILAEEVGELCKLMARKYGEQSFKNKALEADVDQHIGDELADILFVITCLANQMGYNLNELMLKNMQKKTQRDSTRHKDNKKLYS